MVMMFGVILSMVSLDVFDLLVIKLSIGDHSLTLLHSQSHSQGLNIPSRNLPFSRQSVCTE